MCGIETRFSIKNDYIMIKGKMATSTIHRIGIDALYYVPPINKYAPSLIRFTDICRDTHKFNGSPLAAREAGPFTELVYPFAHMYSGDDIDRTTYITFRLKNITDIHFLEAKNVEEKQYSLRIPFEDTGTNAPREAMTSSDEQKKSLYNLIHATEERIMAHHIEHRNEWGCGVKDTALASLVPVRPCMFRTKIEQSRRSTTKYINVSIPNDVILFNMKKYKEMDPEQELHFALYNRRKDNIIADILSNNDNYKREKNH